MASKFANEQVVSAENVEEMLDVVDKNLDRIKTLYEQYFLGIQKQPPTFLHTDIERKLRDLTQLQVRNTGLRYRLATLQQKFGAYNAYWKRTLRQIENGTYVRNLSKIGREAVRTGAEIPEEILAAMPKRMREQVLRDREQALAIAKRRRGDDTVNEEDLLTLAPEGGEMQPPHVEEVAAMIAEPSVIRKELKTRGGAHVIEDDDEFDLAGFFADVERNEAADREDITPPDQPPVMPPQPAPRAQTAPMPRFAPSQQSRPNPIAPGAAAARGDMPVESMTGPFPRPQAPVSNQTGPMPAMPTSRQTGPMPAMPTSRQTGPMPAMPTSRQTGPMPAIPTTRQTGPVPTVPITRQTGPIPAIPTSRQTGPIPRPPGPPAPAPTQPLPLRPPPPVQQTQPLPRPVPLHGATPSAGSKPMPSVPPAPAKPPPGMTDADVNALYAKYMQAKQLVGEATGPREREKLLKTINAQAPKIMEQYKAKAVDFSVVVKDNQVIIRAKPKT